MCICLYVVLLKSFASTRQSFLLTLVLASSAFISHWPKYMYTCMYMYIPAEVVNEKKFTTIFCKLLRLLACSTSFPSLSCGVVSLFSGLYSVKLIAISHLCHVMTQEVLGYIHTRHIPSVRNTKYPGVLRNLPSCPPLYTRHILSIPDTGYVVCMYGGTTREALEYPEILSIPDTGYIPSVLSILGCPGYSGTSCGNT